MPDQPIYSIGLLAQILSVSEATLRQWEHRYPVVVPQRNPAGHRLYSKSQANQLQFVCDQVATGQPRGTAFRLLQDHLASGLPLPDAEEILPGNPARIVLFDDDPRAAAFCDYFLRRQGHQVTTVSTIHRAAAQLREAPPDLVVVDLLAGAGQGRQLCLQVRQQLCIPVLATSTRNLRTEGVGAGATGFLLKPIHPQRLVSVVQHLLSPRTLTTARHRATPAT